MCQPSQSSLRLSDRQEHRPQVPGDDDDDNDDGDDDGDDDDDASDCPTGRNIDLKSQVASKY